MDCDFYRQQLLARVKCRSVVNYNKQRSYGHLMNTTMLHVTMLCIQPVSLQCHKNHYCVYNVYLILLLTCYKFLQCYASVHCIFLQFVTHLNDSGAFVVPHFCFGEKYILTAASNIKIGFIFQFNIQCSPRKGLGLASFVCWYNICNRSWDSQDCTCVATTNRKVKIMFNSRPSFQYLFNSFPLHRALITTPSLIVYFYCSTYFQF